MTLGTFIDQSVLERITVSDLLERYATEETPKKRGCKPNWFASACCKSTFSPPGRSRSYLRKVDSLTIAMSG